MSNSAYIWTFIGACFTLYFIASSVYKKIGISNLYTALLSANGLRMLNLKHLLGIVLFGILAFIQTPELNYLISSIEIPRLHILLLFFVVVFLSATASYFGVKKQEDLQEAQVKFYSFSNAWTYFIIRFVFLLCYEYFFRGVILFEFLEFTNLFLAIFYSTALYVLIHIFDSKKEILGAIPFGIILCLFTYFTNNVWCAFLIHLALSAVYEISVFYYLTLKNKTIS
ncbi:CPBP family intramembrane glutamic endopeptidase [Flavisericum labens]|uniref:CPBP family intramembrane glutamic endopeptidase n=1 Tax=Flavisericum labens TaxID=3377112 RepID=UPI00387B4B29